MQFIEKFYIIIVMKYIKPVFILGLVTLILLSSFTLEIVTLSFDNIMEGLTTLKAILLQLKIINYKGMLITPKILALKIKPLLLILSYLGVACITFIVTNWQLFLYIIVVYIFVKCLVTNFYIKHFKFDVKFNINSITAIWEKRKLVAPFLIKLFLLMIPIRFFIRMCTLTLFNFQADILCIITLVLLTLPFIYYFLNLIKKYLAAKQLIRFKSDKKQTKDKYLYYHRQHNNNSISKKDYFLFNDYVIKNINFYNIIYIILNILVIHYYFYYYLAIILLSLIILILLILYLPAKHSAATQQDSLFNNNINLQARGGPPALTFTWAYLMDNLGMYLTWGNEFGYNEPDHEINNRGFNISDETNSYNQFILNNVYPNHFNSDINVNRNEPVTCYNWLHSCIPAPQAAVWLTEAKDIQHGIVIAKSKILSMVYMQRYVAKHVEEFKKEVGTLNYIPQTLFKNDIYIGSVGRMDKTLVINFLKRDGQQLAGARKQFWPSYYIHDENLRHVREELEPIRDTIRFLETQFGLYIPKKEIYENIITFTEVENLRGGDPSLIKVMRPCVLYTDLYTMYESAIKYFLCAKKQDWGDLKDGSIYSKIIALKGNVQYHQMTDQNRINSDKLLNELYLEYLKTRLTLCDRVEGDKSFNSKRTQLFYNYKSDYLKNIILFREDDLDIFSFKTNCLVDMTWTRRRLVDKLNTEHQYSSFYVVCTNRISMELLALERPYGEIPKMYSVLDLTNKNTSSTLKGFTAPIKQSFNILDKQDGDTLKKLLLYKF